MEAGPSLEGRGLGKKLCKEGLAELAQREAGRIWPRILWMEEERHLDGGEGEMKPLGFTSGGYRTGAGGEPSTSSFRKDSDYLPWLLPLWCPRRQSLLFSHLLWVSNRNANSDSL